MNDVLRTSTTEDPWKGGIEIPRLRTMTKWTRVCRGNSDNWTRFREHLPQGELLELLTTNAVHSGFPIVTHVARLKYRTHTMREH